MLSHEEHFKRDLEGMFAKEVEVVQKWVNKDCKGKKGTDGRTGLAEDEEGIQAIAQRKPTLGRGRVCWAHPPTPVASWLPVA